MGIDPTEAAIAAARAHAAVDPLTSPIDYRLSTVGGLGDSGERFDLVCCLEVVEHTPEPDQFVAACARLVAPGGALVMSTMNRTSKAWLLAIAGAEHLGRLLPVGTHEWSRFRTPAEMQAAMEGPESNLAVRDVTGIVFRPQALRPLSDPRAWGLNPADIDVNYIMHAVRSVSDS